MIPLLYSSPSITITEDFIRAKRFQDRTIPLNQVTGARIEKSKIDDFKAIFPLFLVLGAVFTVVFFPLGLYCIGMAVYANSKKIFHYTLIITWKGYDTALFSSKDLNAVSKCAAVINCLCSQKVEMALR